MRLLIFGLLALSASIGHSFADSQKPSTPNGLAATAISSDSVRIKWNTPWDDIGVLGYNVYRNGSYYATVFDTTYIDQPVSSGTTYSYSIVAFDAAKNFSLTSSGTDVTLGNSGTTVAPPPPSANNGNGRPGAPGGLRAQVLNGNSATIFWSPATTNSVGYNVYRNGSYVVSVKEAKFEDKSLTWGQEYRYQIVAYSADTQFSDKSSVLTVNTANSNQANAAERVNVASNEPANNGVPNGYKLIFSDEFQGYSLDSSKWNSRYRWGPSWPINGEKQYYVDRINNPEFGHSPFEFDGEHMTISATRTPEHLRSNANWQPYLSGALTTYNKFKMRYGYVEMRAKLPKGKGLWSAFWLLHQHENDKRPEIDVVEYIGDKPSTAYNTYHYYDNWNLRSTPSYKANGPDYSQNYHTFAVKWEPGRLTWYVDGDERNRHNSGNVAWEEMYLLVNLAVGGWWPGDPDGNTRFPARLSIDYIRAYEKN